MTAIGITGYAAYVPRYRLDRGEVAAAIGASAAGARAVAGYDEDSTSMAVEAASRLPASGARSLWLSTTSPAYLDKTDATAVHAALDLAEEVPAFDLGASVRSGAAALIAASAAGGIAVLSDLRSGEAGGAEERDGADAAAAFAFGADPIAELVATGSATAEFLDRWRLPAEVGARVWEERFGQVAYTEAGAAAVDRALDASGIAPTDISSVGVAGSNQRAVAAVAASAARRCEAGVVGGDLLALVGNSGSAQLGLVLADLLDHAKPGQLLLLVSLADGADAFVLRAGDRISEQRSGLRDGLEPSIRIGYPQYLVWRRRIEREAARRPDPQRPSAPFARRNAPYKFAFRGGRCLECGRIQFPLPRVCYHCHAVDRFEPVRGSGQRARIVTFTEDRLAFSPSPPLISAVIELERGGRVQCELTDVVGELAVGDEVELTFRRLLTVGGIHNYFWKARPVYR